MAIAGTWRAAQSDPARYATALKQGTGVSNVHSTFGGQGRNVAPDGTEPLMAPELVDEYSPDDYGYDEMVGYDSSELWGYGPATGTSERANWDQGTQEHRSIPEDYPAAGAYRNGIPGGTRIRTVDVGADATSTSKLDDREDAAQGWLNKHDADVELEPQTSDPSQYEMQTSMTQRDKTRAGSQTPAGRENTFDAPIKSRKVGFRQRIFAAPDSTRHYDMEPKSQDVLIRPFWMRTAGTGYHEWMAPNAMEQRVPLSRTPPDDPYAGQTPQDMQSTPGGYVAEDYTW